MIGTVFLGLVVIATTGLASPKRGFGAPVAAVIGTEGKIKCPCSSGLQYDECCQPLHLGDCTNKDPESITRARFSAFAKGIPAFLIDTSHPDNKDYTRFAAENPRDPRKGRKSWEKEIVTKNTNVYEFIKLNILNSTMIEDISEECQVCFQVLVRQKKDGTFIPFQVCIPLLSITFLTCS
jgi:uncharacterized protein YchJ